MKDPFKKVKLRQLYHLCNSVIESNIRKQSYIKHRYSEFNLEFSKTLLFANEIKLLNIKSDEIIPDKYLSNVTKSEEEFKQFVIQKIFAVNNEVLNRMRGFIINFCLIDDKYVYNATPSEKIKYSDVRNLLLELDLISVTSDKSCYVLNDIQREKFLQILKPSKITVEQFKRQQTGKDKLGYNAEKEIIEYEIKRLDRIKFDINEIEHTSQKDVFAGYDIKSFENYLNQSLNRIVRYIEVKAVSIEDYKFYWSKNEMDFSRIQNGRYFLYLLPVKENGTFDIERLKIIADPYLNIFNSSNNWSKEIESYSFSMIL